MVSTGWLIPCRRRNPAHVPGEPIELRRRGRVPPGGAASTDRCARDACFENHLRTPRRTPAPQTPWSGLHRAEAGPLFLPESALLHA